MAERVAEMTPAELRELIETTVERKLFEILGDPDEGKQLTKRLHQRLLRQKQETAAGERGRPLDEVVHELGWDSSQSESP